MPKNIFKTLILFVGLAISLGILIIGIINLKSYFTKANESGQPQDVRTVNITDQSATILWNSTISNQGLIRYSTNPTAFESGNTSALLFVAESKPTTKHEVRLTSLKPNTTYYYQIELTSGKEKLIYDQGGLVKNNKNLPFSFTTTSQTTSQTENLPSLDPNIFKQKFGSNDPLYDLNKDGVVNATDYLLYLSRLNNPKE